MSIIDGFIDGRVKSSLYYSLLSSVSKKYPRKDIVAFIAEGGVRGNTKHAFLAFNRFISNTNIDLQLIWIGSDNDSFLFRKAGYAAISIESEWQEAAQTLLSAKIIIYGTHDFIGLDNWFFQACTLGAIKIQLWHGIPAKKIAANFLPRTKNFFEFSGLIADACEYDYVVIENDILIEEYQSSFPCSKILAFGACRNDILARNIVLRSDLLGNSDETYNIISLAKINKRKIVMFCPTYREGDSGLSTWVNVIRTVIKENRYYVVFKFHPSHKEYFPDDVVLFRKMFHDINSGLIIDSNEDIQPYLLSVDLLVTDYSSVWYDFTICNRNIILFRPDDSYERTRDVVNYDFIDLGKCVSICRDESELIKLLSNENIFQLHTDIIQKVSRVLHRNADDGFAGERLFNFIYNLIYTS